MEPTYGPVELGAGDLGVVLRIDQSRLRLVSVLE